MPGTSDALSEKTQSAPAEVQEEILGNTVLVFRGYEQLVNRAVDVFGDEFKATRWLSTHLKQLDNLSPLEWAEKSGFADLSQIEFVLGQIEHGVYA